MRVSVTISLALLASMAASAAANAQAVPETAPAKPPVEVISYKIDRDYYPMLDRPSSTTPQMSADVQGLPPVESEAISRQRARNARGPIAPMPREDTRSRGILSSYIRVIEDAQVVQTVFRNTTDKRVNSVEWDFAFPRYENGVLLSRFDVASTVEIKPGGKKTIKYKLPAGAKKCEVVRVQKAEQSQGVSTFEAVCGEGFNDPLLDGQRQETISIRRIIFADGTTWEAKDK
jgi:hypothetical protein